MLETLVGHLTRLFAGGNTPALWYSGGKDSRLLLELVRTNGWEPLILSMNETFNTNQQRRIDRAAAGLKVFAYPPRASAMVGDGDRISLISAYAVGRSGETVPIVRDIIDGDEKRCALTITVPTARTPFPLVAANTHIIGTKRADRHWTFGDVPPGPREFEIGGARFVAPLWDWTDGEVLDALAALGIDWAETDDDAANTGNIPCCRKCLIETGTVHCPQTGQGVEPVEWDPKANLALWRAVNEVNV